MCIPSLLVAVVEEAVVVVEEVEAAAVVEMEVEVEEEAVPALSPVRVPHRRASG